MTERNLTLLRYKDYVAQVQFYQEYDMIYGNVLGIEDTISIQGKTMEEVVADFQDAIDEYLDFCHRIGERPSKPFSVQGLLS